MSITIVSGALAYNTTTLNGNSLTSFTGSQPYLGGSGTITFTSDVTIFSYLVVSGGNGGFNTLSSNQLGRGGAGGSVVVSDTHYFIPANTSFTITVGAGGSINGGTGSPSSFTSTIISRVAPATPNSISYPSAGANGTRWTTNGSFYAGGGGGGSNTTSTNTGGSNIGGDGGNNGSGVAVNGKFGANNTGSGGGGGGFRTGPVFGVGGAGGSGIVIFYYKTLIKPTINPWSITTKTYGDAPFTLTPPTSNSSGAFTYTSPETSVVTISGNTVTILQAGTATITASQEASGNYAPGSTPAILTVNQKTLTINTSDIQNQKKWIGRHGGTSHIIANRRTNAITQAIVNSSTNTAVNNSVQNTINSALRRVRAGGAVAPPKKKM